MHQYKFYLVEKQSWKNLIKHIVDHRGMAGSAIVRKLEEKGFSNLVVRTSQELDLRNQAAVADFFADGKPDYVFLAAVKVGGILANDT